MASCKKTLVVTKDQIDSMIRSIRGVRVMLDSDLVRQLPERLDQAAKRASKTESGSVSGRFHVSAHRERSSCFKIANCDLKRVEPVANCDRFQIPFNLEVANCDLKFPRWTPVTSLSFHRIRRSDGREHSE